jgi:hypothetical protein
MPTHPEHLIASARARAEATFKVREDQKQQAPVAMKEYRQAEQARREQTAKLRAQRLAREAAHGK